jgi:hypothetical protein
MSDQMVPINMRIEKPEECWFHEWVWDGQTHCDTHRIKFLPELMIQGKQYPVGKQNPVGKQYPVGKPWRK